MVNKRNPLVSFILGIISPVTAFMYNGKIIIGLLLFIVQVLILHLFSIFKVYSSFYGFVFFIVLSLVFTLSICISLVILSLQRKERRLLIYNKWYFYLLSILLSFTFLYFQPSFQKVMKTYHIPAGSMKPTIQAGDYIVVDKLYYKKLTVDRGDLIIFRNPNNKQIDFVKRCIGIAGDHIEYRKGKLYINNQAEVSKYAFFDNMSKNPLENRTHDFGIVPNGKIFVIGDNRYNSLDSRFFGYIPLEDITGRPLYVYFAKNKNRIGKSLK